MARKSGTKSGDLFIGKSGQLRMTDKSAEQQESENRKVECLGMTFADDDERRNYFLGKLKEKLADPEFRKTPGFPKGNDEDILNLSDPPYYTACPNPWFGPLTAGDGKGSPGNDQVRTPFAADVSEGKNHPIYLAHTYHTKVPHRAIMRYILHYTRPGAVILDGFSGTGMTGVAASLCDDRQEIQELGYRVEQDGSIVDVAGRRISVMGSRRALLSELSPAASFISYNYTVRGEDHAYVELARAAHSKAEAKWGWLFRTIAASDAEVADKAARLIDACRSPEDCAAALKDEQSLRRTLSLSDRVRLRLDFVNYTVWSDVFGCPDCGAEIVFWSQAVSQDDWQVKERLRCQACDVELTKDGLERRKISVFDPVLGTTIEQAKSVPVLIHFRQGTKTPDALDLALIEKARGFTRDLKFPADRMPMGDEARRNDAFGITHVHHFYTWRNLILLAQFAAELGDTRNFVNVTSVATVATKMYRFRSQGGSLGAGGGPLSGTLYVPSLSKEIPVGKMLREHIKKTAGVRYLLGPRGSSYVSTGSSAALVSIPDNSIDYIFVDPPFGGNLMYADLNFLWEAWLRVFTEQKEEAVTAKSTGKGLREYQALLLGCFEEFFRVLKPGRWITVEFSNSQASVWGAIQGTLQEAGFVVATVAALDKKQGSFKAVTTTTAVKQDLVISAYKPNVDILAPEASAKQVDSLWEFVRAHLLNLPVVRVRGGTLECVVERDPRIIFDRVVAYYVSRSRGVPVSSADFQLGLAQRFLERDGMFFLSEQAGEYDRKRATAAEIVQQELFVSDESSAIQWLRRELARQPQTSQELHPRFMQERAWSKHETTLELRELLEQNFICYDGHGPVPSQIHSYLSSNFKDLRGKDKVDHALVGKATGRWYVPDPAKQSDLERVRERALLREFAAYRDAKVKKLRLFRIEAVRAGFRIAYESDDYKTIVSVAAKIPENILQEDGKLLMYYDVASMRLGVE